MKVTDCTCTHSGWCERHQCQKNQTLVIHCQRRPDFFAAWEAGELRELCRQQRDTERPSVPCRHLGTELRQEPCETCRGSVRIKVFGCHLFQECVRGRSVGGLTTCTTCAEYSPVEPVSLLSLNSSTL